VSELTKEKLFVPDGRVTKDGLKSLIEQTKCMTWIYAGDDARKLANEVGVGLQLCEMPALEWCLDSEGGKGYEYTKRFEEAKWDVILVIHTSGTTGKAFFVTFTSMILSTSRHTKTYLPYQWLLGLLQQLSHFVSQLLAQRHRLRHMDRESNPHFLSSAMAGRHVRLCLFARVLRYLFCYYSARHH
jgi:acyl-CoA synthetase (AMP-forming)/AMP-acid ligase II